MIKLKKQLSIFGKIIGTGLIIVMIVLLLGRYDLIQEQKEYMAADGKIVVIFNNEITNGELYAIADQYGDSVQIKKHIGDYALLSVDNAKNFNKTIKQLNSEEQVLTAQADCLIESLSSTNDLYSDSQWYIKNTGHYTDYSDQLKHKVDSSKGIDMDVADSWDSMEKIYKHEVVVAIIDTGVDYSHPDLFENMWMNEGEIVGDNKDNDNNGYVDDIYGWDFYNKDASICHYGHNSQGRVASLEDNDNHGTHVAGIIAAVANNHVGIAGVASNLNIKIMTLKINGGSDGSGMMSNAIEAVKYATMMGADICNLSWGTNKYSKGLYRVIKESDMLFVVAAGNYGTNNDKKPLYPANFKLHNLISVASIDADGELSSYSNYGAKTVDIAAPGDNIYSTVVGSYASMSGSSMAAPQVSAVAALLYSYYDDLYASNIKQIIIDNIKPISTLEGYMKHPGIPNAYQSVTAIDDLKQDISAPELSFKTFYKKGDMIIRITTKDLGASKIRVIKWIYGKKTVEDFKRGVNGTLVKDGKATLADAGVYTFYVSDYSGNETAETYNVVADTKAPTLTTSYTVAKDYNSRTVKIKAVDGQSGIKRVKYMYGVKKAEDFLPAGAGTEISLNGTEATFSVKKDGTYTIFASDYRGNLTVITIKISTVKATAINSSESEKTILLGEQYSLGLFITPINNTDLITYTSSNNKVAVASEKGVITDLSKGTSIITAEIPSGLKTICLIKVNSDG